MPTVTTPTNKASPNLGSDRKNTAFIPGWLDDAGLTLAQFRVYCRISRRAGSEQGECYEKIRVMARGCNLHPDTVREALKDLVKLNLITAEERSGTSKIHRVAPLGNGGRGTPRKRRAYPYQTEGGDPWETEGGVPLGNGVPKGSPSEVTPSKEGEGRGASAPPVSASQGEKRGSREKKQPEPWQDSNDKKRLEKMIEAESEAIARDDNVLAGLIEELKEVNARIAERGKAARQARALKPKPTPQAIPAPQPSPAPVLPKEVEDLAAAIAESVKYRVPQQSNTPEKLHNQYLQARAKEAQEAKEAAQRRN
jgi:hypothetical protein